jgi:(1->4)-alpha-D-glucan 1-alpha-D-glucosylmutase
MHIPIATYRVQLHKDFTLSDLDGILDYLEQLGVTAIYAAPIVRATPGSMHGYDAIDPHVINPEIGSLEALQKLTGRLKEKNMLWLQDIVPNHMAFNPLNDRLMDVLERGSTSPFYRYFDINWQHSADHLKGKLQVPFLGKELEDCINNSEIKISFSENGLTVDYFQSSYPLSLAAYGVLFSSDIINQEWKPLLQKGEDTSDLRSWKEYKKAFVKELISDEKKHFDVLEALEVVNNDRQKLWEVLVHQYYVLTYWKHTEKEIGYRRFFTVNELICLRMEDKAVFDEYHTFLHSLYKQGIIHGLRIDHIDGLKAPKQYLADLRSLFGEDCFVIAEKILKAKEDMPQDWSLQGSSGYEFLSDVNQLITNRKGAKQLVSFYKELVPGLPPYKELVLANKRLILEKYMAGELENLVDDFFTLALSGDFKKERIKEALAVMMIALPVYRIYPEKLPLKGDDLSVVNEAFQKAFATGEAYKPELEHLNKLFTKSQGDSPMSNDILCFLKRLMQFTGPLTAKGVEDTTFYTYNALLSHDEVGDTPSTLGISIANFHTKMAARQQQTPHSLNTTATHDTKRGEDARLRLNVLCEFAEQWREAVMQWVTMNNKFHVRTSKGKIVPLINDEYLIYQAIVGGFPEDLTVTTEWIQRLQAYVVKAVREAKVNSGWGEPDLEYEEACHSFIRNIVTPGSEFMTSFLPLIKSVYELSYQYSLGQVLIKNTAPGIPDTYQGCELWDLSFVDPDNRRPVDFNRRADYLSQLIEKEQEGAHELFPFMDDHRAEGMEKLFVTWKSLTFRKKQASLFAEGTYIPLQLTGKDIITVAFARSYKGNWVLVVVPLKAQERRHDNLDTTDEIILPEGAPDLWYNVLTGETIQTHERLALSTCFTRFSVALLANI